jgi:hypothetical protein
VAHGTQRLQLGYWRDLQSDGERWERMGSLLAARSPENDQTRILQKFGVNVAVAQVAAAVNRPKAVLTTEQPEALREQICQDY